MNLSLEIPTHQQDFKVNRKPPVSTYNWSNNLKMSDDGWWWLKSTPQCKLFQQVHCSRISRWQTVGSSTNRIDGSLTNSNPMFNRFVHRWSSCSIHWLRSSFIRPNESRTSVLLYWWHQPLIHQNTILYCRINSDKHSSSISRSSWILISPSVFS